jgi:hypothetical protein
VQRRATSSVRSPACRAGTTRPAAPARAGAARHSTCSAKPHSATGLPRRTAVITSCSGLRRARVHVHVAGRHQRHAGRVARLHERDEPQVVVHLVRKVPRQPEVAAVQGLAPSGFMQRGRVHGLARHAVRHEEHLAALQRAPRRWSSSQLTWYCALGLRWMRAAVMNSHRLPQPSVSFAITTSLKRSKRNSLPNSRRKPGLRGSFGSSGCSPSYASSFAGRSRRATYARTMPATEHSSVMASAS